MTRRRVAMLGALLALLATLWMVVPGEEEAPGAFSPTPISAAPPLSAAQSARVASKPVDVSNTPLERTAVVPVAAPSLEATTSAVQRREPTSSNQLTTLGEQQAWLPPTPTDPLFDLNGNHRVESDEQERAKELLERAHQFAASRTADGTYPILKRGFRGEGRLFRAIDGDGDGALTEREFLSFEADSIRQLRRYDQNADGALTRAEFGHLDSRFDFLDEDHDGQLYAWEITLMRGLGRW